MNFLKNLKAALENQKDGYFSRNQVVVNRRDLIEIMRHFEDLDSIVRSSKNDYHIPPWERVRNDIMARYHETNYETDHIIMYLNHLIVELLEDKNKRRELYDIHTDT